MISSVPLATMGDNQTRSTNISFRGEHLPDSLRILFLAVGWTLVVNGIFGNIVVILTLVTCQSLRSVHNIFIGNLAIADLIIESYFATFFLADIWTGLHPVVDVTNCIINGYIVVLCYLCSLWTLVSISFNRYLHICHYQFFKKHLNDRRTKAHLMIVWLWAGLIAMPPTIGWGRYGYDAKSHYCGFDRLSSRSYTIMLATSSVALPSVLVCYFNLAILRYVRLAAKRIQVWTAVPQRGVSKSDIALMKSLFVVFVCLAVFMSPYMLSLFIDTDNSWPSAVHVACTCTSILNSSINWILYGVMNQQFRQGYQHLYHRFLQSVKLKKAKDMKTEAPHKQETLDSTC